MFDIDKSQSACGSSSSGRAAELDAVQPQELFDSLTKRCGNLSRTESSLLSCLGNLLPEMEQKTQTNAELKNELEDVRTELDMLRADFQDYRDQVSRDKQEAEEEASKELAEAVAKALAQNKDMNEAQMRIKRENVQEIGRSRTIAEVVVEVPAKKSRVGVEKRGTTKRSSVAVAEQSNGIEQDKEVEEEVLVLTHKKPKQRSQRANTLITNREAANSAEAQQQPEEPVANRTRQRTVAAAAAAVASATSTSYSILQPPRTEARNKLPTSYHIPVRAQPPPPLHNNNNIRPAAPKAAVAVPPPPPPPSTSQPPPPPAGLPSLALMQQQKQPWPSREFMLQLLFDFGSLSLEPATRKKWQDFQSQFFPLAYKQLAKHMERQTQLCIQNLAGKEGMRLGTKKHNRALMQRMMRKDWNGFWLPIM